MPANMTRIGGDDQFMRNFEQSTVTTPADKTKAEEGAKGKGDDGGLGATGVGATDSSGNVGETGTASAENLAELYLVAMETAYNSQATDMMNKSDAMQASNEQAAEMSQVENAITTAQLNANGGDITIVVTDDQGTRADGSVAYITPEQQEMLNNNGLSISGTQKVKADDI